MTILYMEYTLAVYGFLKHSGKIFLKMKEDELEGENNYFNNQK